MDGAPALICIPDITGFTAFMSDVKFENSRIVIPSLLNKIIYANNIGLRVSEIEGDAVLFYKTGELPPLQGLLDQCRQFYVDFNKALVDFSKEHADDKDFLNLPDRLGLKVIMHYGHIGMVEVGSQIKLMGEDVIISHRLLKNNIADPEYILLTQNLIDQYPKESKAIKNASVENVEYEHIGNMSYHYLTASQLIGNNYKNYNKKK